METWTLVLTGVLALANVVLVGVTAWYASLTKNISASSETSAEHAARSAEAAERAILVDVMPLVITEWLATRGGR